MLYNSDNRDERIPASYAKSIGGEANHRAPVSKAVRSDAETTLHTFLKQLYGETETVSSDGSPLATLSASYGLPFASSSPLPELKCERESLTHHLTHSEAPSSISTTDAELLLRFSIIDAAEVWLKGRRRLRTFLRDDKVICALALLYLRNCHEDSESVVSCFRRVGGASLKQLMPERCRRSFYFSELVHVVGEMDAACGVPHDRPPVTELLLGPVEQTQMITLPAEGRLMKAVKESNYTLLRRALASEELTEAERAVVREAFYVPPDGRPAYRMPSPLRCRGRDGGDAYIVHPIGFALVQRPPNTTFPTHKLFDFFPINPSRFGTWKRWGDVVDPYMLNGLVDEWLYATLLRYSMFAFTHKRGGWDCMRHQEELYYGAVPVFVDLMVSPPRTSSTVPRGELMAVLKEPMLSHIGYVDTHMRFVVKGRVQRTSPFMRWCRKSCVVDFVRPGTINLQPYAAEHARDVAAGVASGPLTRRSPVIRRHYERIARPLWNLFATSYSAASLVQYILRTIQYEEPKRVLVIGFSAYSSDYTHETVLSGFSELGIFTESVVLKEYDKFARFSTVKFSRGSDAVTREKLAALNVVRDPRESSMARVEELRTAQVRGWSNTFYSSTLRWNPFIIRRADGKASRDVRTQLSEHGSSFASLTERLLQGEFDLVIYSVVRLSVRGADDEENLPLVSVVRAALPKDRIVFIDHNDWQADFNERMPQMLAPYGFVFQREVPRGCPRATQSER